MHKRKSRAMFQIPRDDIILKLCIREYEKEILLCASRNLKDLVILKLSELFRLLQHCDDYYKSTRIFEDFNESSFYIEQFSF